MKKSEKSQAQAKMILEKLTSEERKSLNMLNNIKAEEVKVVYIRGYNNDVTFEIANNSGFFVTNTKRNFDISIIVKSDIEENVWIQLNLTKIEIYNLYKKLDNEIKSNLKYDEIFVDSIYKNGKIALLNLLQLMCFDLYNIDKTKLITFKNHIRTYNQKHFNYYWDSNDVINFDIIPPKNLILKYT